MDSSPQTSQSALPHEPLREGETIMRRFLHFGTHYKSKLDPPIREGAFHPRQGEKGISLSRRISEWFPHFINEHQLKAACTHPDKTTKESCGVCAFCIDLAKSIGLTVELDPQPDDRGHVILPQINYEDFFGENASVEKQEEIRFLIRKIIEAAAKQILIVPGKAKS